MTRSGNPTGTGPYWAWRSDGDVIGHFDYCTNPGSHSSILTWCPGSVEEQPSQLDDKSKAWFRDHRDQRTYVASIYVPGYLPQTPPEEFRTPWEAWSYLADERANVEDDVLEEGQSYTGAYEMLAVLGTEEHWTLQPGDAKDAYNHPNLEGIVLRRDGTGAIELPTPGYDGDHDLGFVYEVSRLDID